MTNREKLHNMINNLNEDGLSTLIYLFGNMHVKESYNINTTPERLAELKQAREKKDEQIIKDREKANLERAQAEYNRRHEFIASLTGKEKKLFDKIESVKPGTRYCIEYWEMDLLAKAYNDSLLNGSYDIFRYGFLKGQRAERAREKAKLKDMNNQVLTYNIYGVSILARDKKVKLIVDQLEQTIKEWEVLGNNCRTYTRFLVLYGVIQALVNTLVTLKVMTQAQFNTFNDNLEEKYNIYYQEERWDNNGYKKHINF